MKKNRLLKKIRGYQRAPRERFSLLINHILTAEEFVVYELGLAITDWDTEHDDEIYGKFKATNLEMAEICGWKSDSTVSRIKSKLIKKGLFIDDGEYIRAKDFEEWQLRKKPPAKMQDDIAKMQPQSANPQYESAKTQEFHAQTPHYPLVSSNGNSRLHSNEEYESFVNSGQFGSMTIDDMKWIDENVKESFNVPS